MSYVEIVLQKSSALWKQQEEQLQRRLRLLAYGEGAQEESGGIQKIQQNNNDAGESDLQEMLNGTKAAIAFAQSSTAEGAKTQGAQWLRETLNAVGTQGVSNGEARQTVFYESSQSMADAELFSSSLERDARRYDGNFLLY